MSTRPPILGLGHLALYVRGVDVSERFYRDVFGMTVVSRPHADTVYLTTGRDNLSLHLADGLGAENSQRVDHFGFLVADASAVDAWFDYLNERKVPVSQPPIDHGDGARSLYCQDPDGNTIQILHHPELTV